MFWKLMVKYKTKFRQDIVDFIKEYYPDYCTLCMPELDNEHHHVKKFEKVFNDLDLIINDHKKYNLHGVIKDTEKRFESIFTEIMESQVNPEIGAIQNKIGKKESLLDIQKVLNQIAEHKVELAEKEAKKFSRLSFVVSLVDIVISIALILTITKISHFTDGAINNILFGTLFVGFVALLKVTLDRFWLIPRVDKWGWRRYSKIIKNFESLISSLEGLSIAVKVSIDRREDEMKTLSMLRKGVEKIKKMDK